MATLVMSQRERKRLEVMCQVTAGRLSLSTASELLGVGYRQAKRIWRRYQADGDRALVHGLRGKQSNRRGRASLRKRVLARYAKAYADYSPTLAAECLAQKKRHVGARLDVAALVAAGRLVEARTASSPAPSPPRAERVVRRAGADGRIASRLV